MSSRRKIWEIVVFAALAMSSAFDAYNFLFYSRVLSSTRRGGWSYIEDDPYTVRFMGCLTVITCVFFGYLVYYGLFIYRDGNSEHRALRDAYRTRMSKLSALIYIAIFVGIGVSVWLFHKR